MYVHKHNCCFEPVQSCLKTVRTGAKCSQSALKPNGARNVHHGNDRMSPDRRRLRVPAAVNQQCFTNGRHQSPTQAKPQVIAALISAGACDAVAQPTVAVVVREVDRHRDLVVRLLRRVRPELHSGDGADRLRIATMSPQRCTAWRGVSSQCTRPVVAARCGIGPMRR
jgi:hypothetical protein